MTSNLMSSENQTIQIDNFDVKVRSYLGQLAVGIHYFAVDILADDKTESEQQGLLRVGSTDSDLAQELLIRDSLKDYKMVAPLLAHTTTENFVLEDLIAQPQTVSSSITQEQNLSEPIDAEKLNIIADANEDSLSADESSNQNYLEEETYPEKSVSFSEGDKQLFLLTSLPETELTLDRYLTQENSLETSLSIAIQVCQFFRYAYERGWCFINTLPNFIEMTTPIKLIDLTGCCRKDEKLRSGLLGRYCAPETATNNQPIKESASTYTVAALLYHLIHQKALPDDHKIDIIINPIPRVYQLLKIALSPLPEDRFGLSQFLNLLIETRRSLPTPKIAWNVASRSTVGLSTQRLQNEDNFGVRQLELSTSEALVLGVVADGMGGMAQGEVASKLAVQTVLEEPIPVNFTTVNQRSEWLLALMQKANENVAHHVRNGGTTLSLVLGVGKQLMIAHVGDSRIYLLRKGEIKQLSEDHSLVGMLVASGQITYEQSLEHPDRNVLLKSIGSKKKLADGYVQQLDRTCQDLSMILEDRDILLLCSDGVWDLVYQPEMADIFSQSSSLQSAVDETIDQVLKRGAHDNATLLALQFIYHAETHQ